MRIGGMAAWALPAVLCSAVSLVRSSGLSDPGPVAPTPPTLSAHVASLELWTTRSVPAEADGCLMNPAATPCSGGGT